MKQSFALAALVGVAMSRDLIGGNSNGAEFIKFLGDNNKGYKTTQEYRQRQQIYNKNDDIINQSNSEQDPNDPDKLVLGHNWTSDLTDQEYLGLLGLSQNAAMINAIDGLEMGEDDNSGGRRLSHRDNIDNTNGLGNGLQQTHRAVDVDWAYDNKMGDVKDQGSCGSCWAFAATTALEGTIAIKKNRDPVRLSEQQIVDCTLTTNPENQKQFGKDYHAWGCQGGWMSYAWDFMHDQGAMTDADYPYNSGETMRENKCSHDKSKTVGKVDTYNQIKGSVAEVKAKLREQPLAVALDAGKPAFQFYRSGVVKESDNCGTSLNHAVTLIGYTDHEDVDPSPGPDPKPDPEPCNDEFKVNKWWHNEACDVKVQGRVGGKDEKGLSNYWKVQNSWGRGYGDQGFIRIQITDGQGVCGINKAIEWVDWQY